jgi:cytidine deaminase
VAGLAHECPDTDRLSFERTAGPPLPNTLGTAWPHKSSPSPEWPITGLPAPPKQPLTTHRSFALRSLVEAARSGIRYVLARVERLAQNVRVNDRRDRHSLDEQDMALIEAATGVVAACGDSALHTVGAAVLADDGSMFTAVNVFAQGGGACAELAVLAKAISEGKSEFRRIVAVGDRERGVIGPCGVCRQLLLDYAPTIEVIISDDNELRRASIRELMPMAQPSWFAKRNP